MKNLFVLFLCLFSFISFSQSNKNKKRSVKFQESIRQVDLVSSDSLNNKRSVFFKLKDTVSSVIQLNIPTLNISEDLSVYAKYDKKKSKKKNSSKSVDDLLLNMRLQQGATYHQQQMMQAQQQAQRVMQQNMMRIP